MENLKEIQKRIKEMGETEFFNGKTNNKKNDTMSPDKMRKLWIKSNEDVYITFNDLTREFNLPQTIQCQNWFIKRGWGKMPERKPISEKYSDDIYSLYKKGLNGHQIANELNINSCTVYKHLKDKYSVVFGVTAGWTNGRTSQDDINLIRQLLSDGNTVRKTASITGFSKDTVMKYKEDKLQRKILLDNFKLNTEKVIELYNEGNMTQTQIADKLGISRKTVGRYIKKHLAK